MEIVREYRPPLCNTKGLTLGGDLCYLGLTEVKDAFALDLTGSMRDVCPGVMTLHSTKMLLGIVHHVGPSGTAFWTI